MTKYAAFLRGINVGGRIIKMADLKICLARTGFENVATILQSGNVVFTSKSQDTTVLKHQMEGALTEAFHYPAIVFVYSIEAVAQIVTDCPFEPDENHHRYVVFIACDADVFAAAIAAADTKIEEVKIGKNCLYWCVPKGKSLDTTFSKQLNTAKLKPLHTIRNLNTLEKIVV